MRTSMQRLGVSKNENICIYIYMHRLWVPKHEFLNTHTNAFAFTPIYASILTHIYTHIYRCAHCKPLMSNNACLSTHTPITLSTFVQMHTNVQRIGVSRNKFLYMSIYMHTLMFVLIQSAPARSFKKRFPTYVFVDVYMYMCMYIKPKHIHKHVHNHLQKKVDDRLTHMSCKQRAPIYIHICIYVYAILMYIRTQTYNGSEFQKKIFYIYTYMHRPRVSKHKYSRHTHI